LSAQQLHPLGLETLFFNDDLSWLEEPVLVQLPIHSIFYRRRRCNWRVNNWWWWFPSETDRYVIS